MEPKSTSERFAKVIETAKNNPSSGAKPMQSGDRDKQFSEIRKLLDLNKNRPADIQASARLVDSFVESIQKNNDETLRSLEKQDKKLLEDTLDAITKLQFKTVEEFKNSLKDINDLAAKMIARSESDGPKEFGDIGKNLQNQTLDERFKSEGLTLKGEDDTFGNRLKQQFFGNSKEPGREGAPTKGFKEGFKNAGSEFMGGFKRGLTPQSGVLGSIFNSQESRREEIRNEVNQSNEKVSEVERLKKMFSDVINSKTETNNSTSKSTNSDNNRSESIKSTSDSSKTEVNQSTNDNNRSESNQVTNSDNNRSESNQFTKQSTAEFKSIDRMSNLTEEHKKTLEQQGIKPSSEKDFSYRKDGKPVSMEEINQVLKTTYKESQEQPKVKIQSAKSEVAPNDKNDVASILTDIKKILVEIKDKLFDKKRAGVAPSGKKQLDPSSNVKEVMNRNKAAQVDAEQASANAEKRAENIDKQNAEKASAKVEAKEKSAPKVVIGGTESSNSRVTPETPATGNGGQGPAGAQGDTGAQGGGGSSLLGGITAGYAGFKSGGEGILKSLKNQRYSPGLSKLAGRAEGVFSKGTNFVEGAAEKVTSRVNAIKSKATDFISDRVSTLRGKATDFIKNRGLGAEQLLDKNGKTLSGAAKQSRIGNVYRNRAAGVVEKGKGMLGKASQFGKGMLGKASGFVGKEVAKGSTLGKVAQSGMGMLGSAKGAIGKVAEKAMASSAGKGITKAVSKIGGKAAGKIGAKAVGKSLLKKIPIIGAVAGLGFGAMRALQGDFAGAAGEVASGVASTLPGMGTAASFAIDAGLAARDISRAGNEDSAEGTTEPIDGARAEGGPVSANGSYLVGENGPEIFSPNSSGAIKTNPVTKSNLETGANNAAANLKEMTESAKEDTAPVINVPPPTVIQQPAAPQQNGGGGSLPMDTVRTEDSSWQRFQNRRSFG